MFYTITTRTRKHGIWFEPHELEPIGITEDSRCWGAWVEADGWDKFTRLDNIKEKQWTDRQSLHLIVSPTHPDSWPAAFNVQLLLQRREIPDQGGAEVFDGLEGATDALKRCGVNILFVRTAQLAYNMLSFSATCEFPDLEMKAKEIVDRADIVSQRLHKARKDHLDAQAKRSRTDKDRERLETDLRNAETIAYSERVNAFRRLGALMMPRLAGLEARLLLIDYVRHQWETNRDTRAEQARRCSSDTLYELIVGTAPTIGLSPADRSKQFTNALQQPWFLYSKSVCIGDNAYFLDYGSITQGSAGDSVASTQAQPGTSAILADHTPRLADEDKPEAKAHRAALGHRLYDAAWNILKERKSDPRHRDPFEITQPSGLNAQTPAIVSAAADWAKTFKDSDAFRASCLEECFSRHAFRTITCAAIPYLAYARLWSEHGGADQFRPFQFSFSGNLLRCEADGRGGKHGMAAIYNFLDSAARLPLRDEDDRIIDTSDHFRQYAAVFVNMDLDSQCARLRFLRSSSEDRSYMTITIHYEVPQEDVNTRDAKGLLHSCVAIVGQEGFRVERASNRPFLNSEYVETLRAGEGRGYIKLTLKAVSKKSFDWVQKYAEAQSPAAQNEICAGWTTKIKNIHPEPSSLRIVRVNCHYGIASPTR